MKKYNSDLPLDIEQEIKKTVETNGSLPSEPITLDDHFNDLGRMSAEAVLTQWEAAAKAVEEMGHSVGERVKAIAASMLECDRDMKMITETAKAIRDKGKLVEAQIEEASALSGSIRAACDDFKKKVGLP